MYCSAILYAGQVFCSVAGKCVPMDLIIQARHTLLSQYLEGTAVPDEFWSYVLCVIAALAFRRIMLADLGKSNLTILPGDIPRLRFIDLGSWEDLPPHESTRWPSKNSQLWSFMGTKLDAMRVLVKVFK